MRIGHGYDVHRLVEGRALILGGVNIPFEKGLLGHSDADVLTHALMDAMLGAAGLGDIGKHFPDTDPQYKGADSLVLLAHVKDLLQKNGYCLMNADITLIAQKPKVAPYLPMMKEKLAQTLQCDLSQLNIKATTEEHLGFTGEGAGMACHAVCLIDDNG
ncbi:MAG: 2-C-methyl-D-erythritol 2,4-cyclodiphosphate synthase [Clostridia bacterium]|nr:2-C-methyl-D-erythritol 2,4-cyclodiphosphate synthase [Clostridia bacterium]